MKLDTHEENKLIYATAVLERIALKCPTDDPAKLAGYGLYLLENAQPETLKTITNQFVESLNILAVTNPD